MALSYLTKEDLIGKEDTTPPLSQAIRMKQLSRMVRLTPEEIVAILFEEKPNQKEQVRIKTESIMSCAECSIIPACCFRSRSTVS